MPGNSQGLFCLFSAIERERQVLEAVDRGAAPAAVAVSTATASLVFFVVSFHLAVSVRQTRSVAFGADGAFSILCSVFLLCTARDIASTVEL